MNNKNHPKAKGEKTQAIVLAELIKRDYVVLLPFGDNQRYDFVIYENEKFIRAQCKTGTYLDGCVKFNTCSTYSNYRGWHKRDYKGDIDIFLVYSYEMDKVYKISIEDVGVSSTKLRVETPKKITETIKWAKNYELL